MVKEKVSYSTEKEEVETSKSFQDKLVGLRMVFTLLYCVYGQFTFNIRPQILEKEKK